MLREQFFDFIKFVLGEALRNPHVLHLRILFAMLVLQFLLIFVEGGVDFVI